MIDALHGHRLSTESAFTDRRTQQSVWHVLTGAHPGRKSRPSYGAVYRAHPEPPAYRWCTAMCCSFLSVSVAVGRHSRLPAPSPITGRTDSQRVVQILVGNQGVRTRTAQQTLVAVIVVGTVNTHVHPRRTARLTLPAVRSRLASHARGSIIRVRFTLTERLTGITGHRASHRSRLGLPVLPSLPRNCRLVG